MMPITAFCAGLAALWLLSLTGKVTGLCRERGMSLGHGGDEDPARGLADLLS